MCFLVIKQLLMMFLIAASGFVVTRQFKFGELEQQFVSKILIYFVNPILVFSRFDMDFDTENLRNFGIVLVLAIVIHFVMVAVALVFFRSKYDLDKEHDKNDKFNVVFKNFAFI